MQEPSPSIIRAWGRLIRAERIVVGRIEAELKSAGIVHLHLWGSRVNGHARPDSDVDLAAVFDRAKVRTALREINLKNRLSELLGAEVDLCNERMLQEDVRASFEQEAELVF